MCCLSAPSTPLCLIVAWHMPNKGLAHFIEQRFSFRPLPLRILAGLVIPAVAIFDSLRYRTRLVEFFAVQLEYLIVSIVVTVINTDAIDRKSTRLNSSHQII